MINIFNVNLYCFSIEFEVKMSLCTKGVADADDIYCTSTALKRIAAFSR